MAASDHPDEKVCVPAILDATHRLQHQHVRRSLVDPPEPELEGDVFDRQRVMVGFDQRKIEDQIALVLGTGGLGQNVAIGLARLGVAKIIFVDRDVYEASNLTRQLLGCTTDVGRRKVDVAADHLRFHNLRSEIVPVHTDIVEDWATIVKLARGATVVFNCCDYGAVMDYATNSLCKALGIPYVAGSSYAYSIQTEFYSGLPGKRCWACNNHIHEPFLSKDTMTSKRSLNRDLESFAAADGFDSVNADCLARFHEQCMFMKDVAPFVEAGLAAVGSRVLAPDQFQPYMFAVRSTILAELSPARILHQSTIHFIPREPHYPTRNVGSWVAVCVASAMFMVNAFVQFVTGDLGPAFPNSLDMSMVDFGLVTDRKEGAVPESEPDCDVCNAVRPDAFDPPPHAASDPEPMPDSAVDLVEPVSGVTDCPPDTTAAPDHK